MHKISLAAAAATIVVSSFFSSVPVQQADAMVIYPWCAHYGGRGGSGGGAPSCGFVTFAQCMATVSGTQGYCDVNPWWEGPLPTASAAPRPGAKKKVRTYY